MRIRYSIPGLLLVFSLVAFTTGDSPRAALLSYQATLSGAQEVPPNGSPATGSATITIDDVLNTLTYNITFSGLLGAETGAHIHGFAPAGVNAGAIHPLPAGSPKIGVWNYAQADEADIIAGLTYINIHSTLYAGGEIRGQILPSPTASKASTWGKIKRLYQ